MTDIGLNRRRGGAYIAVMGVSVIVTVIGLSALLATRVEFRAVRLNEAATSARFAVASGMELGILRISADADWRNTYVHDEWTSEEDILGAACRFKLVDEQDGDLANDPSQPARFYAKATVSEAVRMYSVLLEPPIGGIVETRVAADDDDAEERSSDGRLYLNSSDLELAFDVGTALTDTVGMRFTNVAIPLGATIASAYVQFKVDHAKTSSASLTIRGEDVDDAAQFSNSGVGSYNITSRSTTGDSVAWSPPAWNTEGEAGVEQRTSDISSVIQEIVDRPGWSSGNALVIIITGGIENVTAVSHDGDAGGAPLLHVQWDDGGSLTPLSGTWRREVGS